ncbi:MAG TPA: CpaF family protein [Candidatus Acidoferrales bacterium]|nr:CpaF family protein [Candidatus Acidoferrales bacterium]
MGLLDRVKSSQENAAVPAPPSAVQTPPPPTLNPPRAAPPAAPGPPTLPPPQGVDRSRLSAATPPPPTLAAGSRSGGPDGASPAFTAAKVHVHAKLLERYADKLTVTDRAGVREKIQELADEYFRINAVSVTMTKTERDRLVESLLDDVLGLGPMQQLVDDPDISEIMINHPKQVYIERQGQLMLSGVTFESSKQLMLVIDRIVSTVGRRVDESTPMCDARLQDGSRVNVIIPPLALKGPCLTIRKFSREKLGPQDLLRFGSGTVNLIQFLEACVRARFNILVSGGTGSGKTTLLNILSSFIPAEERIITCEDAAELQLQQDHVITLESRPPNVEGKGAVLIRDLVKNCLRMRPDRIIVGECRGGEALDMLQAMNTGHDGSMSTLHANNPHEALGRLETLVLMAGAELPSRAIREQMASAVHLIVQQQRLRGGPRKIVSVSEITGMEGGEIKFQEIFKFVQVGVSAEGQAIGYHTATGIVPLRMEQLKSSGEDVPEHIFQPTPPPPMAQMY